MNESPAFFLMQYGKLNFYYKFVYIVIYVIMAIVEIVRLYLGYVGNLQEKVSRFYQFLPYAGYMYVWDSQMLGICIWVLPNTSCRDDSVENFTFWCLNQGHPRRSSFPPQPHNFHWFSVPLLRCVKCNLMNCSYHFEYGNTCNGHLLNRVKNCSSSLRQGSKTYIFVSWTGLGFRWFIQTLLLKFLLCLRTHRLKWPFQVAWTNPELTHFVLLGAWACRVLVVNSRAPAAPDFAAAVEWRYVNHAARESSQHRHDVVCGVWDRARLQSDQDDDWASSLEVSRAAVWWASWDARDWYEGHGCGGGTVQVINLRWGSRRDRLACEPRRISRLVSHCSRYLSAAWNKTWNPSGLAC